MTHIWQKFGETSDWDTSDQYYIYIMIVLHKELFFGFLNLFISIVQKQYQSIFQVSPDKQQNLVLAQFGLTKVSKSPQFLNLCICKNSFLEV